MNNIINATFLQDLLDNKWSLIDLADAKAKLKRVINDLPDEQLIDVFRYCFVNDYKIKLISSNYFSLKWDECVDGTVNPIKKGKYHGQDLIEFILTRYETLAHFSLCFNYTMSSFGGNELIFPYNEQTVICCKKKS